MTSMPRLRYIAIVVPLAIVLTLIGLNARGLTARYSIEKQPQMDISSMRREIRVGLQTQLREQADDRSIRVIDVNCLKKSDRDARCLAEVSDPSFRHTRVPIHVDVDPDNGAMMWNVES